MDSIDALRTIVHARQHHMDSDDTWNILFQADRAVFEAMSPKDRMLAASQLSKWRDEVRGARS